MEKLRNVRQRVDRWIKTNIGSDEEYRRAPQPKLTPPKDDHGVFAHPAAEEASPDFLGQLVTGEIEVPDFISPPAPTETAADFAKGVVSDTVQSFGIGVAAGVLQHLVDSPTAEENPKKTVSKKSAKK